MLINRSHRRIERLWRADRSQIGKGWTCPVRQHARNYWPERAASGSSKEFAAENKVDLRTIELDVASQGSADAAIQQIVSQNGRLDVVIHNAGHMVFGPAEALTPEQLAELYDINVLSTQRLNRAALPVPRKQCKGFVVWVGSSTRGGTPPYLAPYFAAKAGMDALAVSYAWELARWKIETTIVVPGAFTSGTNHFAHAGSPEDTARLKEYESGPTANLAKEIMKGFELTAVPNADVTEVAKAIVKVVDMPFGTRPFRVHIDPAQDGAEIVNGVAIRVRAELLRNMKLADLLRPSSTRSRLRKRHNVRCPESVTSPTERVGILFAVAGVALEFDVGVQIEHAQGEALPPSSLPAPAYAEERANKHRE